LPNGDNAQWQMNNAQWFCDFRHDSSEQNLFSLHKIKIKIMVSFLKKLFGIGPGVDVKALMDEGAVLIDVRTAGEYARGHVKGAINIPLDQIDRNFNKIKKMKKTVVTCCQSGRRSGMAASRLNAAGIEAHNGGGWSSVKQKLGK
jgi:phage shock protein E